MAKPMRRRGSPDLSANSIRSSPNLYPTNSKQQIAGRLTMTIVKRASLTILALALLGSMFLSGCSSDPEKGKVKYLNSGLGHMQKGKYQEPAIQFRNALNL